MQDRLEQQILEIKTEFVHLLQEESQQNQDSVNEQIEITFDQITRNYETFVNFNIIYSRLNQKLQNQ